MKNWLITIANGPRDAFGRVANQYFTVYAADESAARAIGEKAACLMSDYWEVRDVEPL